MPKNIPQPTTSLEEKEAQRNQAQNASNESDNSDAMRKPLSGSKKVKNRNHSRQNHGEGS